MDAVLSVQPTVQATAASHPNILRLSQDAVLEAQGHILILIEASRMFNQFS